MPTRHLLLALSANALLCLPAAAKMRVNTQHQKGNDCKQYKTYEWLPTRALRSSGVTENDEKATPPSAK